MRADLDYDDLIYDQPRNFRLSDKIETVQYNAALAITGAIWGTSREKLYQGTALRISFPLRVSSVNVTKSAGNCGFGHISEEILHENFIFCAVGVRIWIFKG